MRPRLLPATIGVVGLLLVSKTVGLLFSALPERWALHEAVLPTAEAASATEASHPAAAPGAMAPPGPAPSAGPKHVASTATAPPPVPKPSDPPAPVVGEEERRLLQDLRTRRQEWDARDRTLTQREGVLSAAEQRVVTRANELAALQAKLEQLEKMRADRDDTNWAGLVKIYETMKPRDAAAIFNDMDLPVLLQLTDRMKEAKAASVFAAMQPDRARLVTAQLAAKRSRTTALDHSDSPNAEGSPHP